MIVTKHDQISWRGHRGGTGDADGSGDGRPATRALTPAPVEVHIDERAARPLVGLRERLPGDLGEEALEIARVRLFEDLADRRGVAPARPRHGDDPARQPRQSYRNC